MATTGGFILGLTLAQQAKVPKQKQASMAIVGGMMPSPLLGALVVQGLLSKRWDNDAVEKRRAAREKKSVKPPEGGSAE